MFEVTQNSIGITSIHLRVRSDDLIVIDIGTHEKYPAFCIGSDPGGALLLLYCGEQMLPCDRVAPNDQPTEVKLPRPVGWEMMAESGRYTVVVVMWREPPPEEWEQATITSK